MGELLSGKRQRVGCALEYHGANDTSSAVLWRRRGDL